MNIFDYINDALNKTAENVVNNLTDTIEDFKNLINNKIQLEKAERSLQEYFETDGKEMYKNITDFHGKNEAYYSVNVGIDGKQEFSIYNVKPKNYALKVENNIENIEESVVFRLKSGKVVIDEEMTKEYRNARNDNTNYFSRLEIVIKENKLPADFLENMEKDMLMEMFNYLDKNLENKSLYKVESEIINGFCVICEIRKEKDKVPSAQIEKYKILASELPEEACKNTLLIKENGKFVIDKEASEFVENKLIEKVENYIKNSENN